MVTIKELRLKFEALRSTTKRTEKEKILLEHNECVGFQRALQFLLDPEITTGISRKKVSKQTVKYALHPSHQLQSLNDAFDYLGEHNTGTDYDIAVIQEFLKTVDEEDRKFCEELLIKTYRCGVDATTVNKVYGKGFIPEFKVMLAKKYFECPEYVKGKSFTLTQKLDGIRCIVIKEGNRIDFFSRQGKKITGLTEVQQELSKINNDFVLDGELLAEVDGSSVEGYSATTSILLTDGEKTGLVYHAFDCLTVDEFLSQECWTAYTYRRKALEDIVKGSDHVSVLPVLYCGSDIEQIKIQLDAARENQQEGIMININDAPYCYGRTKDLLKVKVMQDVDLRITGYEEGKGALEGKLGAFICDYKGTELRVGSGYDLSDREEFWSNKEQYIGRVITVQYFEETVNKQNIPSLRFPVFLRMREAGKEPSYN